MGGQGERQRRRRRGRTRGHDRRRPSRRRAHERGDDAAHLPLAGRRLRHRSADHRDRRHARGLDRLPGQPGRRRVRHRQRPLPLLAQEPPADTRLVADRDRPQPQLQLSLGRRRPNQRQPGEQRLPRAVTVLDARGSRHARLHGQPRGRRPAADPDGDHLPRVRSAGDVAVRLHEDQRARRHDHAGPRGDGPDRPDDGRQQRLHAAAGERPVHQLRARAATTSTASTGSSRTPSSSRPRATRTIRRSPPRPVATRRPCSTSWSGRGVRSACWAPRSAPLAAAPSTTTSRSIGAGP